MRTADSIAQQAEQSETRDSTQKSKRGRVTAHLRPYMWKPGQSGNPGGRKTDTARSIARAIFQNNEEEIYKALGQSLLKGNAYVFKELAERRFGKLTETHVLIDRNEIISRLAAGRKRIAGR